MHKQIEVITYEQDRLNYFVNLMQKAQKKYKRLFKKFKDAPYLSEEAQILSDAGRETHFYGDVVEMLEKSYRKQSEGEWKLGKSGCMYFCSSCNYTAHPREVDEWNFCPRCGAKMKGDKTDER